jgi:hypothetical protein
VVCWFDLNAVCRDVAKPSTLGGGMSSCFDQLYRKRNRSFKIVKSANHFITFNNFDHLISQTFTKFFRVLPSSLSKYQFHFDQLWANISSILTNFDQRLNYWGGVTPPPPHSDVPGCLIVYYDCGTNFTLSTKSESLFSTKFPEHYIIISKIQK